MIARSTGAPRYETDAHREEHGGSSLWEPQIIVIKCMLRAILSRAVVDFKAPSSLRAIAEFEKENVRTQIVRYALWRCQSEADAEDLVANAIIVVCDPKGKPWDPARGTFFHHMRYVMDRMAIEQARRGYGRFEEADWKLAHDKKMPDPKPAPDEALHGQREAAWLKRMGDLLLARIEGKDKVATQVFLLGCQGIEEPAEMAAKIGCTEPEVREAERRLKYHAGVIKAAEREVEAARMEELRRKARKGGTP